METEGQAVLADGTDSVQPESTEQSTQVETKAVPYQDYKRMADDMHKYKGQSREAVARVAEVEAKLKAFEEEALRKNNKHKELAERYKLEAEQANAKVSKLTQFNELTNKMSAVETAALSEGLRSDALEILRQMPIDGVEVEITDTGRYLVHGADDYVKGLKAKHSYLFKGDSAPKINPGGGTTYPSESKVTINDLATAEKKRMAGQLSNEEFTKLYERWQKQGG